MWQLESDATKASLRIDAGGVENGGRTTCGDEDADTRAPPSNAHYVGAAVATVEETLVGLPAPADGGGVDGHGGAPEYRRQFGGNCPRPPLRDASRGDENRSSEKSPSRVNSSSTAVCGRDSEGIDGVSRRGGTDVRLQAFAIDHVDARRRTGRR